MRRTRWYSFVLVPAAVVLLVGVFGGTGPAGATFAGRNGLIVFETNDTGDPTSEIFTVKPDGSDLRQLTHTSPEAASAFDPHWSRDGRRIAYVSDASGSPQVWVMDFDGSHQHQVTDDPDNDYFQPSWSPDGSRMVVSRCSHFFGTCDIDVMRADGSSIHKLVGGFWHNAQPVFSPDGEEIAFTSDRGGYDSLLWIVEVDGDDLVHITAPALVADRPVWAPDGERLTFTGNPRNGQVFTIAADGSHLRTLTSEADNAIFATYSPDGKKMVMRGTDPACGCAALVIMNTDGTHRTPLPATELPGLGVSDWGVAR